MHNDILRGEVYFADLDPVFGREYGGTRPVLIIQNNTGNNHSDTTVVAAIAQKRRHSSPTHVLIQDAPGMKEDSMVLLEQIRTIDMKRLAGKLSTLSINQMHLVDIALMASLGIRVSSHDPMIMTLCQTCVQSFRDSSDYALRQTNLDQDTKEPCTLCNIRTGYDYEVTRL